MKASIILVTSLLYILFKVRTEQLQHQIMKIMLILVRKKFLSRFEHYASH